MFKLKFLSAAVVCFLVLGDIGFFAPRNGGKWLQLSVAEARSGGGRSRGGSFSRPSSNRPSSSPSRSSGSSSGYSPSRPAGSSYNPPRDSAPSAPPRSSGNTGGRARGGDWDRRPTVTPVPVPNYPSRGGGYSPNYPPSQPYPYNPPRYPSGGGTTVIVPVPVPQPQPRYYPYPAQPPYYPSQPVPAQTPYYPSGGSVAQPVPPSYPAGGDYRSGRSSNNGGLWSFLLFLLICGGILLIAWMILSKKNRHSPQSELDNDIVTVTKLQVALLAEARHIQAELSDLAVNSDLETAEGLTQFLQESALALLRSPEYWSHVLCTSQTVKSREEAQQVFEQFSIKERSNFSAETLSNVGGYVQRRSPAPVDGDEGPAAYIVVTFLVGTADDKPLFDKIYSAEHLRAVLTRLAGITSDYLFVFELLWSPQEATDTLTYDELLTEYADMIQI
ncbi:DUF1517 domain-containing protein [Ancylothrix sp. C2]|uniref:DUF1517 domain-containing protein n=1 Tax=Ancylothrix sp. D3o TaxID=2953691 RepID=UPI0021BB846C|nr:DUF1517 domain-containing protein [Ancylothrix sp. D3o]MCT7948589.1 DUF1517 domain-containing protein [Ancylothrix sp. D3o]